MPAGGVGAEPLPQAFPGPRALMPVCLLRRLGAPEPPSQPGKAARCRYGCLETGPWQASAAAPDALPSAAAHWGLGALQLSQPPSLAEFRGRAAPGSPGGPEGGAEPQSEPGSVDEHPLALGSTLLQNSPEGSDHEYELGQGGFDDPESPRSCPRSEGRSAQFTLPPIFPNLHTTRGVCTGALRGALGSLSEPLPCKYPRPFPELPSFGNVTDGIEQYSTSERPLLPTVADKPPLPPPTIILTNWDEAATEGQPEGSLQLYPSLTATFPSEPVNEPSDEQNQGPGTGKDDETLENKGRVKIRKLDTINEESVVPSMFAEYENPDDENEGLYRESIFEPAEGGSFAFHARMARHSLNLLASGTLRREDADVGSIRREDADVVSTRDPEWTRPWKRALADEEGIWFCPRCQRDQIKQGATTLARKIGVSIRQRHCLQCRRLEFCKLYGEVPPSLDCPSLSPPDSVDSV
ncbi:hypothetical protein CDD83_8701 [Cordyceps sp. RAO-2017]|nr:hypothetical protein CDD83_8701 [Cordyceps sp. RAO-2017]